MKNILFHYCDFNHLPEREKLNEYGGIGYYRVIKPSQYLGKHAKVKVVGKEIQEMGKTFEGIWSNIFNKYDAFYVNHFLGEPNAVAQAYYSRKHKKSLIYDIDDNFLDVPKSNEMHKKFLPGTRERAMVSTTLSFGTTLTVSTEPLRDKLKEHFKSVYGLDKKIIIVPNMNDLADWDYVPAEKHGDKIVIGYSGSNSHQDDLVMVMPAVARLMKKYRNLHFELIGCVPKVKVKEYFGHAGFDDDCLERIRLLPATPIFRDYPQYLSEQRWDIGICPLVDNEFTRCKSHIKWMEYSMYKMPVVASRTYPYFMELCGRQTITDGETGFLAQNIKEWEEKLERLILDKDLRLKLGTNSYEHIKKNWQYKDFPWDKVLADLF